MEVVSVINASINLCKLLDDTAVSREPVISLGREANAVLVGEGDWIAINETLNLLSVLGMRESIAEGIWEGIGDCARELDW